METKPIPSIPGALARSDGRIKLPDTLGVTRGAGMRLYKTKWIQGTKTKASKTARHEYFGIFYRMKNYKVHRLVCEAFHGAPPEGRNVVMHLNECATDNRPENLRWGSQKENLNAPGFIAYCRSRTGGNNPVIKGMAKKKASLDHGLPKRHAPPAKAA